MFATCASGEDPNRSLAIRTHQEARRHGGNPQQLLCCPILLLAGNGFLQDSHCSVSLSNRLMVAGVWAC
jgi:hypothetical protein